MNARATSPFERAARAEKVKRLTNVLDRALVAQLKIDPLTQGDEAAARLELMAPAGWAKAAELAKCIPPSPQTIAAVIETYRERARIARTVAS